MKKLKQFNFDGNLLSTKFVERIEVLPGVQCDVYSYLETSEQDLGIITIQPGKKTPLQKVLSGKKTIEGFITGKGSLSIWHIDGTKSVFQVSGSKPNYKQEINIGEIMQWEAAPDSVLEVFEVCFPPYKDGRYENLSE